MHAYVSGVCSSYLVLSKETKNLLGTKSVHVVTIFINVCNVTIYSFLKTFLYCNNGGSCSSFWICSLGKSVSLLENLGSIWNTIAICSVKRTK